VIGNTYGIRARTAAWPLIFVVGTVAMLATRLANAGSDPIEWLRAGLGALSVCAFLVLKRGGVKRAFLYTVALECFGGVTAFVFVDAPVVQAHMLDIVRAVALVAPHGLR